MKRRTLGKRTMTTFLCSGCKRTISASGLIEREPMCRACRKARSATAAASDRRHCPGPLVCGGDCGRVPCPGAAQSIRPCQRIGQLHVLGRERDGRGTRDSNRDEGIVIPTFAAGVLMLPFLAWRREYAPSAGDRKLSGESRTIHEGRAASSRRGAEPARRYRGGVEVRQPAAPALADALCRSPGGADPSLVVSPGRWPIVPFNGQELRRRRPDAEPGAAHLWYFPGYSILLSPLYLVSERPFWLVSAFQWTSAILFMVGVYYSAQYHCASMGRLDCRALRP